MGWNPHNRELPVHALLCSCLLFRLPTPLPTRPGAGAQSRTRATGLCGGQRGAPPPVLASCILVPATKKNKKMPASGDLILKTVVPAVGTVVCFFLYLAPARAVLAARRRGCLGVSVESVERWVSFFFRPSLFFRGGGGLRRWHTPPLPSMPSGSEGGLRGHGAAWRLRRPFGDRARATLHARAFFLVVRGARLGGGQRASFNPFLPHPQRPTRTSTPSPWSPCWPTRE